MQITIRELNSALIACQKEGVSGRFPSWFADDLRKRIAQALVSKIDVLDIPRDSKTWNYMRHIKEIAFRNEYVREDVVTNRRR